MVRVVPACRARHFATSVSLAQARRLGLTCVRAAHTAAAPAVATPWCQHAALVTWQSAHALACTYSCLHPAQAILRCYAGYSHSSLSSSLSSSSPSFRCCSSAAAMLSCQVEGIERGVFTCAWRRRAQPAQSAIHSFRKQLIPHAAPFARSSFRKQLIPHATHSVRAFRIPASSALSPVLEGSSRCCLFPSSGHGRCELLSQS